MGIVATLMTAAIIAFVYEPVKELVNSPSPVEVTPVARQVKLKLVPEIKRYPNNVRFCIDGHNVGDFISVTSVVVYTDKLNPLTFPGNTSGVEHGYHPSWKVEFSPGSMEANQIDSILDSGPRDVRIDILLTDGTKLTSTQTLQRIGPASDFETWRGAGDIALAVD